MLRLVFSLCLILISFPVLAASADNTHEYQLKNGLKLIVREDHRTPVVFTSVWYKVGSSYEQNGLTGISHALEHMMFRGTSAHPTGSLVKIINANGGLQNAMTTNDYTMYYQILPADKLAVSFQLEADRMHNLLLKQADFAKEIQVVMEERRMNYEDNPQVMSWVLLNSAANLNSPDQHPTIGWKSDLEQMNVEELRNWYRKWYAPNNAIVVVVGDVVPEKVYQLAEQYFGVLKPVAVPKLKNYHPEPYVTSRSLTVNLPAKLPMLMMAYNTPSVKTAKKSWEPYALLLLSDLLGNSDSSRLAEDMVRRKHMAVGVAIEYDPFHLFDSLFIFQAIPAEGHTNAELKTEILRQIKLLQQKPVTQAELERSKTQFIADYIYEKDSLMNQAETLGEVAILGLDWRIADKTLDQIKAITPAQIQEVATTYFQKNRLTIANLIPTAKSQ